MPSATLQGKTVCVIDAYGLIYQAYYAGKTELTNSYGEPTGAVFGFAREIIKLMRDLRPDYFFCAYDLHGKTFRNELYEPYKANRSETPDDLLMQFNFTREFLKAINVPTLQSPGFEADDALATAAKQTEALGGRVILVTSDKDARQLLTDSTTIYHARKNEFYNVESLMNDWGIAPNQVVDYQALVGDAVDNVPGVPLVGPKNASELLRAYHTLEGVLNAAGSLKGKRYENLVKFRDQALLSRKLVKLRDDVPLAIDWDAGRLGGVDPERLRALFLYWNFRSILKEIEPLAQEFGTARAEPSEWFDALAARDNHEAAQTRSPRAPSLFDSLDQTIPPQTAPTRRVNPGAIEFQRNEPLLARFAASQYGSPLGEPVKQIDANFSDFQLTSVAQFPDLVNLELPSDPTRLPEIRRAQIVNTREALEELRRSLDRAHILSVAVVTDEAAEFGRVRARYASLCGLALACELERSYYLPFQAPLGTATLDRTETLETLRPYLESRDLAKVGSQLKYDALVLRDAGIQLRGVVVDVILIDYLARSGETQRSLDDLARAYLGVELFSIKSATGSGQKRVSIPSLNSDAVAQYAGDLAQIPLVLAAILRAKLERSPSLVKLYSELEIPLMETLAEMEYNGVAIAPEHFAQESKLCQERKNALEREIREEVARVDPDPFFARTINLNSTKQLQRLLFDDLKLRTLKKNKSGPSVDAEVLETLAEEHPIPEKIVELRRLVKLQGTYLEPLPLLALGESHRIFTTFNQEATATGRLSSSDPNLQNIPARTEAGKRIRAGFIPDATLGFDAFLSCDYSQIELRILAHFSNDPELKRAFFDNVDIHASVAAKLFGTPLDKVTSDMRRKAKAVNFGLVYGQTSFGLSKSLGISPRDAADYIDAFFATYPGVLTFFDRVLEDCASRGYVQTPLGRRRALTGVRGARGRKTLNFPERAAINAVVQGAAADLMKLAMINVWRKLRRENWIASHWAESASPNVAVQSTFVKPPETLFEFAQMQNNAAATPQLNVGARETPKERAKLLLQIHDELLFETKRDDADELAAIVVDAMTLNNPLSVPLKVDAEIGVNWGEL